ncbi:hypothetical protein [Pseudomonas sp. 2(2015)]|uniref:hypothetical protein n=1 Tax=Pseudomonas sp. 2(2015) TaxID=1619950 RepID=UPI0005EB47A8|nr:hypothetical protein [Pseudomonas sp. 2(2015)]KJK17162.1 hypothetical protein UB48_15170 [Pseudomonas sp. 2(2015)]
MTEKRQGPINGADSSMIEHMVCGQIEQRYDELRMRQFWTRLFAGDNDPKAMAEGLCRALSGGHYVRKEAGLVSNLTVQMFGTATPEEVAKAVRASVAAQERVG